VLAEKRGLIVPLAIAAIVNIGVYGLAVYPLRLKSLGAADRAASAARALQAAEQDSAAAKALVSGKSRAEEELTTFYGKVLPTDQLAALRLTFGPLATLARKSNVQVMSRRWQPEPARKDQRLARLVVHVSLAGDYEAFRQFIYELETAPEFVIIDDVTIAVVETNKPLVFTLELSTYYPLTAHGH
jgi:Tfp pilus assembly protein PilO